MSAAGFRGGASLPEPEPDPIEQVLRNMQRARRMREAELPAPPPGFYWHAEQRIEEHPSRDAIRLIVTWELREVH